MIMPISFSSATINRVCKATEAVRFRGYNSQKIGLELRNRNRGFGSHGGPMGTTCPSEGSPHRSLQIELSTVNYSADGEPTLGVYPEEGEET